MKNLVILLIAAAGTWAITNPARARTIHINAEATGDYPTIQSAADAAEDDDIIICADGTYTGEGNRDIDFMGKAIMVHSENGPENCVVDCEGSIFERHRGFYFHSGEDANSVVSGFTITNGYGWIGGGGILCEQSGPTIENCRFESNRGYDCGGGIYNADQSSPTIRSCTFYENQSGWGGAIYNLRSSPSITGCTFSNCSSFEGGAIASDDSQPTVIDCTFQNNTAFFAGGAMTDRNCQSVVIACTFTGNYVFDHGGTANQSGGGAISQYGGHLLLENCEFADNTADYGGGAFTDGQLDLKECVFKGNSARQTGGAITSLGDLAIENCHFDHNYAWAGGAISLWDAEGVSTLLSCTFVSNSSQFGGAIDNSASLELVNCILAGNGGGGIFNGGGDAEVTLTNCTLTGNVSAETGAIYGWGPATLTNCIVWGNTNGLFTDSTVQIDGMPLTVNFSCVEGSSDEPGWIERVDGTGNIDVDPLFVLPGNWDDGGTPAYWSDDSWIEGDYRLLPGSPCIDAGTGIGIVTDYLGNPRQSDGNGDGVAVADMGAFEVVKAAGPFIAVSSQTFNFVAFAGQEPVGQTLLIHNPLSGVLNWTISHDDCNWLTVGPLSGSSAGEINEVSLTVDATGLARGQYECNIMISDPEAWYSPVVAQVRLRIYERMLAPGDFGVIQEAVDATVDGDEVVVADGIYTGEGNRDIDFQGKAIVVRSGNGPQNCIIDCGGSAEDRHRGFLMGYRDQPENAVLDGFTVINGYHSSGGAVRSTGNWITIRNCRFTDNTAQHYGGGVYCDSAVATIENCRFMRNTADRGGGLHLTSYPWTEESDQVVKACSFIANSADSGGGLSGADCSVINSIICGNQGRESAAVSLSGDLINCTVTGNRSENSWSGLWGVSPWAKVSNCILWDGGEGCSASEEFAYRETLPEPVFITSCIKGWKPEFGGTDNLADSPMFVRPGFWDHNGTPWDASDDFWVEGDYRLLPGSPCIDAGTNDAIESLADMDMAGSARLLDGDGDGTVTVDIGAFEFAPLDGPLINASETEIDFFSEEGSQQAQRRGVTIQNAGIGQLNWSIDADPCAWLTVAKVEEPEPNGIIVTVDPTALNWGLYPAQIRLCNPQGYVNPVVIDVRLNINRQHYVPQDFETIQQAVNIAVPGDIITVSDGVYTGEGNRDIQFWGKPLLLRSANGPANCIIDPNAVPVRAPESEHPYPQWRGLHRAFTFRCAEDERCVVDGFTIIRGGGPPALHMTHVVGGTGLMYSISWYTYDGGAILCYDASPTIRNCIIRDSSAWDIAGAVYLRHSNAVLLNCSILSNQADHGAGVYVDNGQPIFDNCVFTDNKAEGFFYQSITDTGSLIRLPGVCGGAVALDSSGARFNNCLFSGNLAQERGAGAVSCAESHARFSNCTFTGNRSLVSDGCGALNFMSQPDTYPPQDPLTQSGENVFVNCIFQGNFNKDGFDRFEPVEEPAFTIDYSCVQGLAEDFPGLGNFALDPRFVDTGYWDDNSTVDDPNDDVWVDGDYHLKSEAGRWDAASQQWVHDDVTSRCIDAGSPGYALGDEPADEHNVRINMGVYGGTAEASRTPHHWSLLSDMTNDGVVGLTDFAIQLQDFGDTQANQPGDLDRSGAVDIADVAILADQWLWATSWHE